jgi:uncharacterized membrane protein YeaQ/YmgE (transglycosylase-associated protein family)
MLAFILLLLVIGFIAGLIARAIVPGSNSMSILSTTLLGIIGSFVGGFLFKVLFNTDASSGELQPSGFIGSVIGAVIALVLYNLVNKKAMR